MDSGGGGCSAPSARCLKMRSPVKRATPNRNSSLSLLRLPPLRQQSSGQPHPVRKVYGKDRIRYLRCRSCAREFSERKNTALFNTKIEEKKAISVAEHLAEGVSTKVVYNFCRPQRGLRVPSSTSEDRRRYEQRTPAMAASLTDFIWTVADALCTPVYPTGGTR